GWAGKPRRHLLNPTARPLQSSFPRRREPSRLSWRDTALGPRLRGDDEERDVTRKGAKMARHFGPLRYPPRLRARLFSSAPQFGPQLHSRRHDAVGDRLQVFLRIALLARLQRHLD